MECVELWDRENGGVDHLVTLVRPWESLLWASGSMECCIVEQEKPL